MSQSLPVLRDTIIPIRQAGAVLGVHRHTVRNWIMRYPSIGLRIGSRLFIYKSVLQQIVDGIPLDQVVPPSSRPDDRRSDDERLLGQSGQKSERHCCQV